MGAEQIQQPAVEICCHNRQVTDDEIWRCREVSRDRRLINLMPHLKVNGKDIQLNEEGFIEHQEDWNEDAARAFGVLENIPELTADHWKVIYYLRDYYLRFRIAPMIRKLCKDTGISLKEIEKLFPSGPAKAACKLAGLPKPTGCL